MIIEDNGTLEMHEVGSLVGVPSSFDWAEAWREIAQGRIVAVYTARWRRQGNIVRGCFSPLDGDLKPDNEQTYSLLLEDDALIMS